MFLESIRRMIKAPKAISTFRCLLEWYHRQSKVLCLIWDLYGYFFLPWLNIKTFLYSLPYKKHCFQVSLDVCLSPLPWLFRFYANKRFLRTPSKCIKMALKYSSLLKLSQSAGSKNTTYFCLTLSLPCKPMAESFFRALRIITATQTTQVRRMYLTGTVSLN